MMLALHYSPLPISVNSKQPHGYWLMDCAIIGKKFVSLPKGGCQVGRAVWRKVVADQQVRRTDNVNAARKNSSGGLRYVEGHFCKSLQIHGRQCNYFFARSADSGLFPI